MQVCHIIVPLVTTWALASTFCVKIYSPSRHVWSHWVSRFLWERVSFHSANISIRMLCMCRRRRVLLVCAVEPTCRLVAPNKPFCVLPDGTQLKIGHRSPAQKKCKLCTHISGMNLESRLTCTSNMRPATDEFLQIVGHVSTAIESESICY
jgi:hypothetical protein